MTSRRRTVRGGGGFVTAGRAASWRSSFSRLSGGGDGGGGGRQQGGESGASHQIGDVAAAQCRDQRRLADAAAAEDVDANTVQTALGRRQLTRARLDTITRHRLYRSSVPISSIAGWRLGSRVVSVLDSGAEGPGFKSQPRRCRVTVLGKPLTPIVTLFTKQQNW